MGANADRFKAIVEGYLAAYNALDVEAMLDFLHLEIVFKNVAGGEVNATATGIDEFREMAEQSKSLFASRRQVITSFDSSEDTARVGIKYKAVLAADLPNGMKAGDTLLLNGTSVFKFRDDKLYRITDYS